MHMQTWHHHRRQWWAPDVVFIVCFFIFARVLSQPPPPASVVEAELQKMTTAVSKSIAKSFSFCIDDPEKDWNGAFNYTSNMSFVENCMLRTNGDLPNRLCLPAEVNFYFKSLYSSNGNRNYFLNPNRNCNISSWAPGCEPGWACSVGSNEVDDNSNSSSDVVPPRTFDCQPCCEGFFCPQGLTCMMPCPLGAYCPIAKLNRTTGLCDPYNYQLPPGNTSHTCGTANMWADVGSTQEIFCPGGFYCPTTTQKIPCSRGNYCRLGSTTQNKCIWKGSCKPNSTNQNIAIFGVSLVVVLGVLLLVIYNFSGQFLTIRERKLARSREAAARMARENVQARERWKKAGQFAKKHVTGLQHQLTRTFSRRKSFKPQDSAETQSEIQEVPLILAVQSVEMAEASSSAIEEPDNISWTVHSIDENIVNGGGHDVEMGLKEKSNVRKGKHRQTNTQVFEYAYAEIEREKVLQQEHKDLTFTGVLRMTEEHKRRTRPLLEVAFKDLTLTLGEKNIKLLRSVTGKLTPGRVTAVMGPSGAGKTTFLNAVAGKTTGYKRSGSVLINKKHENIRSYRKIIGFVPQDDIVHGNLTVEENLWFSAKCRLPKEMLRADKILVVERVIESLDLRGIRSSLVGTVEKRGISGGQRKRVNVGLEMVMEPSLLILDEPTSGLDSSSSQLLLRALRHEALEGVNVCAVVHQPSYTLYKMFDDLILLAKGGLVVYNGPVNNVEEYFASLGIHVPDRVNPPDHYIDILEGISRTNSAIKAKHLPLNWMLHNKYEVPDDMKDDLREFQSSYNIGQGSSTSGSVDNFVLDEVLGKIKHDGVQVRKSKDLSGRRTPGIIVQYKYFLGRVAKQRLREAWLVAVDFLILGLAGICIGLIARFSDTTFGMSSYTYTIIAVSLLCKIGALKSFSVEKLQYQRERESGMSTLAYFLARDTIDHFNTAIKPIIYLSMFYFFNNPRSTIFDNYIVMLALVYCVTGMGYAFAICFQPGSAQLWSALLPVVLTLLSTQSRTPVPVADLCYPKWALEAFLIINAKRYPGVWLITRCAVLYKSHFDIHHYFLCILVLLLYGVFFRIVAYVSMILQNRR